MPAHELERLKGRDKEMASGLGVQPHVIEAVLNHVSGHKAGVAGTYNRSTYEPEKRTALDLWADRLTAIVEGRVSNVTPLKRGVEMATRQHPANNGSASHEAVALVKQHRPGSIGRAEALVKAAVSSGEVRSRERGIEDYSLGRRRVVKISVVSKDDLLDWLERHEPRSAPANPAQAATPKRRKATTPVRDRAEQAINALWPDGPPSITVLLNGPLCTEVCNWIKTDCEKHGVPYVGPSNDTILRAAGRK